MEDFHAPVVAVGYVDLVFTVDRENRVYVADGYNRRVEIFHVRTEGGINLGPESGAGGGR